MRYSIASARLPSLSLQDHRSRRGGEWRRLLLRPLRERIRRAASKRSGLKKFICRGGRTTERAPQSKRVKRQDISRSNLVNHKPKTKRRKVCQNQTHSNERAKISAKENRPQPTREGLCGKRYTTSAKASMERAPPNRPSPSDYPKPGGPG